MSRPDRFPPGVTERIGFYVYMLLDPRSQPPRPFYVGKGVGERAFAHARAALRSREPSDKLALIRKIHRSGREVLMQFVRHGLDERTAFEVEAAVLDVIDDLANAVGGRGTTRGLCTADELMERYCAQPLTIDTPVILIRVARRWYRDMPDAELYDATRKRWKIAPQRARRATYAVAVADGIVRAVYQDLTWRVSLREVGKDKGRWMFTGTAATDRAAWIGRSVVGYLRVGSQNPIRYVGC